MKIKKCINWLTSGIVVCIGALVSISALAQVSVPGSPYPETVITVDCANGESIQEVLDTGEEPGKNIKTQNRVEGRLIVVVRGLCTELVQIQRNDVTIRGENPGDGIIGVPTNAAGTGSYRAVIADNVEGAGLEQLTIIGPGLNGGANSGIGIRFTQNTTMNMRDVDVGGFLTGVSLTGRSGSSIVDSQIHDNRDGLSLTFGSGVSMGASSVTATSAIYNNSRWGAQVVQSSNISLSGVTEVYDNASGVHIGRGSTGILSSTFTGNTDIGVLTVSGDLLLTNSFNVSGSDTGIVLRVGASAQIGNVGISGNNVGLRTEDTSSAIFDGFSTVNISNNTHVGVMLLDASFASFLNPRDINVGGNDIGIACWGTTAHFVESPPGILKFGVPSPNNINVDCPP